MSIPAATSAIGPTPHADPWPGESAGPAATGAQPIRAEAVIDSDAIVANTSLLLHRLKQQNPAARLMAVVKADGYGHGAVPVRAGGAARAAPPRSASPPRPKALQLRAAGITAPVLAWLWPAGEDVRPALAAGIELAVSSLSHLDAVLAAGAHRRRRST